MKTMWKGMALAAVALSLTACEMQVTEPVMEVESAVAARGGKVRLSSFTAEQVSDASAHPASATGGARSIRFTGSLETPTPCYTVTADARRFSDVVEVTVTASPNGFRCIYVIATFGYRGEVVNLSAGNYTLRVIHTYPQSGWETQVAQETPVTVY